MNGIRRIRSRMNSVSERNGENRMNNNTDSEIVINERSLSEQSDIAISNGNCKTLLKSIPKNENLLRRVRRSDSGYSCEADDWQNFKSVLECNRFMLENQLDCDIYFCISPPFGESEVIGAHKFCLISRSPVFFAMLRSTEINSDSHKSFQRSQSFRDQRSELLGRSRYNKSTGNETGSNNPSLVPALFIPSNNKNILPNSNNILSQIVTSSNQSNLNIIPNTLNKNKGYSQNSLLANQSCFLQRNAFSIQSRLSPTSSSHLTPKSNFNPRTTISGICPLILPEDSTRGEENEQDNSLYIETSMNNLTFSSNKYFQNSNEIKITDLTYNTFWQMLRYIYCEECDLSIDSVFSLLYASKKYFLNALTSRCITFLSTSLDPENVCTYVENFFLFEEETPDLKKQCFQVIQNQSKRVFHSDSFYELSKQSICQLLRMERLSILEIDVFRACEHWAERRLSEQGLKSTGANKRSVLAEALFLIHVPAMSIDEFTRIVVPTGIIETEVENLIFRSFYGERNRNCFSNECNNKNLLPFPTDLRNFVSTRCEFSYCSSSNSMCGSVFIRHTANSLTGLPGTHQHSRWFITLHCDHSIKIQEISFLGGIKGHVSVVQSGCRKCDLTSQTLVGSFNFGEDELLLDAGLFTISSDSPFVYSGQYFTKGNGIKEVPAVNSDPQKVNLTVKECSTMCLMSGLAFVPTDEIYFIENYYNYNSLDQVVDN